MRIITENQLTFSSLIFDTFFGLILFFSIDSLLDIKDPIFLVFYIFTIFIVAHWWLVFKSADDIYGEEVTNSAADLVFGILDVVFLNYIVLLARRFDYMSVIYFMIALLIADLLWAITWRYVGEWDTKDEVKIAYMEGNLNKTIMLDGIFSISLVLLALFGHMIPASFLIAIFIGTYLCYIAFTFIWKIISIQIF